MEKNTDLLKMAQEITEDLSGRQIKIPIEEKVKRVKEFLRMVAKFEKLREAKCSDVVFKTALLPNYIKLTTPRLSKMFLWLVGNWKQYSKTFPDLPDFEEAKRQTADNILGNTWDEGYVNKDYPPEVMAEAFSVVKSMQPTPKKSKKKKMVEKHSQVSLARRMKENGMVYSKSQRAWVPEKTEEKIPGDFIKPIEMLKKAGF